MNEKKHSPFHPLAIIVAIVFGILVAWRGAVFIGRLIKYFVLGE